MVEEFKKSYKNGFEVMLKPEERDLLVEYINELEQETNRLKRLWEADKQNWSCIMYEKEKEIDKLKNNKPDLTNFIKIETAKLNRKREQEKNRLYSENLLLKNDVEGLSKRLITLEETIRKANNNVIKDIAMIKTHEMVKQEIVQRLIETSKILENGSDKEC